MSKHSISFSVPALNGKHDLKAIKRELDRHCPGVLSVAVGLDRNVVSVDYDDTGVTPQQLHDCLSTMGFSIAAVSDEPQTSRI